MADQTVTRKIFELIVAADDDGAIERSIVDKVVSLSWGRYFQWKDGLKGELVAWPEHVMPSDDGAGPVMRFQFSFDDLLMFADDDKPAIIAAMRKRLDELEAGA